MSEGNFEMPNQAFEPVRERLKIVVGEFTQQNGRVFRVEQILDFNSVIGVDVETGRSQPLRVGDLRPLDKNEPAIPATREDLAEIADEEWRVAQERYAAIEPLLNRSSIGRDEVEKRASEVHVSAATLYRWIQRYQAFGVVTALIARKRGWKDGASRLGREAEQIIEQVIKNYYLSEQRSSPQQCVSEVRRICVERGIELPSPTAIRARINRVSEREKLRGRGHREKAINKFQPAAGKFPNATYPLAVVQIDHTPADIIVVDDLHRKPIGRPWITLAVDAYSRMVTGYYLSFDPPSETSVAMCVAHSILPKEEWLLLHKVEAEWPVWGIPRTIHVDNGADFRSNNFKQSCVNYGINLEFRPVRRPRFGGTIERALGTLLREIHNLPGTTFSSVKDRDGYDSEKHAAMTLSELEEWLVALICKVYHKRLHASLGMPPLRKWEIGIFGNAETQAIGLPPRPTDRQSILLDFLPSYRRTVQTYGVTIEGITYYAEALRLWINADDPESGKKREFVFRRDPRDISVVWFFDPHIKQYFKIPFADQSLPAMSAWEFEQAKAKLKQEGVASVNEHQILRAIGELRSKVDAAKEKTKSARRQAQRRVEHEKGKTPVAPLSVQPETKRPESLVPDGLGLLDGDIEAFGDIA